MRQTTKHCPTCGSPIESVPVSALLEASALDPHERLLVEELARIYPRGTTISHLVHSLYGADPNGGPDTAHQAISVYMSRARRKLADFGWTITKGRTGPGSHSNFKMEPM